MTRKLGPGAPWYLRRSFRCDNLGNQSREGAIDSRVAGVITLLGQQQPIQPYRGLDYNGRGVDSTRLLSR